MVSSLIRGTRKPVKHFLSSALLSLALLVGCLILEADEPNSKDSTSSETSNAPSNPVATAAAPSIVIGFVGGFVRHDNTVHSTVILARNLQRDYAGAVHVETFENRRVNEAHKLVLHLLGSDHKDVPTADEKRAARIILYGHSWGASAAVTLARQLQADGIPVRLTVQVDSVAKGGQNDAVIPNNVKQAANFYQAKGLVRGQPKIRAADASTTQILGNFRFDYSTAPISCQQYPWFGRVFMRSHIEIECDPVVWRQVEGLIRTQLPSLTASQPL
jgi:hypothetical protein